MCLWAALQNDTSASLINKGREEEKMYDWIGAVDFYEKAVSLVSEDLKVAELRERVGNCFLRAAFQAETKEQFISNMKQAAKAYEQTIKLFQKVEEARKEVKINDSKAKIIWIFSWLELDWIKRKNLLDEWWNLKKEVLTAYEEAGDLPGIGRTCNDLLEGSSENRVWLITKWTEREKVFEECISYGEKAIDALSKIENEYELARAYCWTSWYYAFAVWQGVMANRNEEFLKKSMNYSEKALKLSEKIGDALLIGRASDVAALFAMNTGVNLISALKFNENTRKQGTITKNKILMGVGNMLGGTLQTLSAGLEDDPDKHRKGAEKAIELVRDAIVFYRIINCPHAIHTAYTTYVSSLCGLASIETNLKEKRALLEKAIEKGREFSAISVSFSGERSPLIPLSRALYTLSKMETDINQKKWLLEEALEHSEKMIKIVRQAVPFSTFSLVMTHTFGALILGELSNIEPDKEKKIGLLQKAVSLMESFLRTRIRRRSLTWTAGYLGYAYFDFSAILNQLYILTKENYVLLRAIEVLERAIFFFEKNNLITHMAESQWKMARFHDQLCRYIESSSNYESAAKTYKIAGKKIPQLKKFYQDHSLYMQGWSEIEQARYSHSIEDYGKAKEHYDRAAKLHELSEPWSHLAANYFAWASMEEAERLSRQETTQQAKQSFQKAYTQFCNAEESFKQKLEEISSSDEREMIQRLLKASDLRRKYCQARILMEEAKLLDREGRCLQSSRSYGRAAQEIDAIVDKIDVEAERKELKYIAILCQAWEKMANAEETTSAEAYLEAAALFEQAKEHCFTRKASLWALGNSNFCKGLAAGVQYQTDLDLEEHAKAKGFMKSASTNYSKAGFKAASEYAKATQRLFDAYLFMNQAERESDPENRARQYQMAENLLQIAAGSFMKAKQPEKTAQVQEILANVREEKTLAISLSQVMKAPTIASTTQSFTAPTPTSEVSFGLESFEHANVQANLISTLKEVKVGESFCLSVELVNVGREPALLTRVEDFVPSDFVVVKKPEIYRLEDTTLNMKGKQIAPLKLVEAKLVLQPSKKGKYQLNPRVYYLDERGQNKTLQLKTLEIKVEEVILENRVSTGTQELDSLLLGGIPEDYAVVLTGTPSDERDYLIKNFLKAGTYADEITFYVSTEADGLEHRLEKPNFYLFLCNPKPKTQISDLPNVYKLRSKTDLTNLSISLSKAYRNIEPSSKKRICVEIVSDVLVDYETKATRKWISELITDLGAKGFTMLAVINPLMHTSEELHSVLDLFDGEINLIETEDPLECKKSLRVKKLRNQDYIKNPICLT
jgi:KaiC/GvpD/RAD55 family RecA-like ATPase